MIRSVLCFGVVYLCLPLPSFAQLRPELRVNTTGSNPNGPNQRDGIDLTFGMGRFAIAWADQAGTSDATQDIFVAVSNDDGKSFGPGLRVDLGDAPNQSDAERPELGFTASGALIVAFEDARAAAANGGSGEDLLYNRSADGGLSWLPVALPINNLTHGPHQSTDVDRAALAISGEHVFIVWEEDLLAGSGGPEELWFNRSLDGGLSFDSARIVSGTGMEDVDDPALSAQGQEVLIAFVDNSGGSGNDVWTLFSDNTGQSFARKGVEGSQAGEASEVRIARDANLVAVLWHDDSPARPGPAGVHLAVSQDGGRNFGPEIALSEDLEETPGASLLSASIAICGDAILVVHADDSEDIRAGGAGGSAAGRAYTAYSADRGLSWVRERALESLGGEGVNHTEVVAHGGRFVLELGLGASGANRVGYCQSSTHPGELGPIIAVPSQGDVDHEAQVEGAAFALNPQTGTALSAFWDQVQGQNELFCAGQELQFSLRSYCAAGANSAGFGAEIRAQGSPFLELSEFRLTVSPVPNNYGMFVMGLMDASIPFGQGTLCVAGQVHILGGMRLAQANENALLVDTQAERVSPGRRCFQYLFRDPALGAPPFSSANALEVYFQ